MVRYWFLCVFVVKKWFYFFVTLCITRHREPQSGAAIQRLWIYPFGARGLWNNITASSPLASRNDVIV